MVVAYTTTVNMMNAYWCIIRHTILVEYCFFRETNLRVLAGLHYAGHYQYFFILISELMAYSNNAV